MADYSDPGGFTSFVTNSAEVKLAWRESVSAPDWSVDTAQGCDLSLEGMMFSGGAMCGPALTAISPPPDRLFAVTSAMFYPSGAATTLGGSVSRSVWSPGGSVTEYEVFILDADGQLARLKRVNNAITFSTVDGPTVSGSVGGLSGLNVPGELIKLFAVGTDASGEGWLGMSSVPVEVTRRRGPISPRRPPSRWSPFGLVRIRVTRR